MVEYTGFRMDGTRAVMSISGETRFIDLFDMFKQYNMVLVVSECGYVYRSKGDGYWLIDILGR